MKLQDKVSFITDTLSDIGRKCASAIAREGVNIAPPSHRRRRADQEERVPVRRRIHTASVPILLLDAEIDGGEVS
jgi:NAD(P)-dependent dehydrogenase (short-subunit alcohol dehydrogenase family)